MPPRVLTLDIETAPLETLTWNLQPENIGLEFVKEDSSILSVSWKWLGEDKVHFIHTGGRGVKRVRDDKKLLKKIWELLDQADICVGQNIKAFDLPRINARMLIQGMKPYSEPIIADTMLMAKSKAAFTSNKLAWLSKKLTKTKKSEHKKFPGFSLWSECLKDNKEAWAEMEAYNKRDVESTEELYLVLRPWMSKSPNMGTFQSADVRVCPKCGSSRINSHGLRYTSTGKFRKYRCKECGGHCTGKENLLTKAQKKGLLVG